MLEQNLYNLNEKFNVYMNIEKEDKERFKDIIAWTGEMMEMTIKEKYTRNITPLRGEIWTCQFGQNVGSEVNKVRPALVISHNLGNSKSPTLALIPITSREPRQQTHVAILDTDLVFVENSINGTITAEGVRNVSKARLGRRIGQVTNDCMLKVEEALKVALGFEQTEETVNKEEQEALSVV